MVMWVATKVTAMYPQMGSSSSPVSMIFPKIIGLCNVDLAISIKIFSSETARDNNLNFILEILGAKAYKLAGAKFWIFVFFQIYRTLYVKPFEIFFSKIARGINFKFILEILGAKAYKLAEAEFWIFVFLQNYRTLKCGLGNFYRFPGNSKFPLWEIPNSRWWFYSGWLLSPTIHTQSLPTMS